MDTWLEESLPRKLRGLNDRMDFLSCSVLEMYGIARAAAESAGILVLGWEHVSLLFIEVP